MPTKRNWVLATSLGFCLAFLSFLPGQEAMKYFLPKVVAERSISGLPTHINPDALPDWLDRQSYEQMYQVNLIGHIFAFLLFGLIVGMFQYYILRKILKRAGPWILGSVCGFTAILLFEVIKPHLVIGPHEGPLEPIIIALGGGSLAGFFQWIYLRSTGVNATRWLFLWIGGIMVGIIASIAVIIPVEILLVGFIKSRLPENIAILFEWGIFLLVYGGIVGLAGGWISGGALLKKLYIPEAAE